MNKKIDKAWAKARKQGYVVDKPKKVSVKPMIFLREPETPPMRGP